MNFDMYSGYLTVNESHGRNMFYWFVESQSKPSVDPLVLWLNGGPGCSSLGGLMTENGPFWINKDGATLQTNPYSWNRIANVLYLESPSGVGFSTSNTSADYTTGDDKTAMDSYLFLLKFFEKFPQFASNPLWISGESYAGHYVPKLSLVISQMNAAGQNPKINIQGFQVGNAWTDPQYDNKGAAMMWWSHSMISDNNFQGMLDNCDFSNIGPLKNSVNPAKCNSFVNQAFDTIADINIYQIYADVCLDNMGQGQAAPLAEASLAAQLAARTPSPLKADLLKKQAGLRDQIDRNPCREAHMTSYLNRKDVQDAIHVKSKSGSPVRWTQCSSIVNYSRKDLMTPMQSVYQQLLQTNLRMLVFSGDIDGIVPTTGTRLWLAQFGLPITESWRPWMDSEKQVGGFCEHYKGLTFASVRDAGHMVPWDQPLRSYDLFSRFLLNQKL